MAYAFRFSLLMALQVGAVSAEEVCSIPARNDYRVGSEPISVATGDFNGDGILNVAVATHAGWNNVSVLLGNGDGTLQAAQNTARV